MNQKVTSLQAVKPEPPRKNLTQKQEAFCRLVSKGNNLSDAYRGSYNAAKMKENSIHRKASEVHALPAIRARIAELAKKIEEETVADRLELLQIATTIARGDAYEKSSDILKAVEILSRMQGYDAPSTSIALNLAVRRSPEEMREILRRQVDFTDLELFEHCPPAVEGVAPGEPRQIEE